MLVATVHRLGQYSIPPSEAKFLARPAIKRALGASLLIVVAPGGFGKTTVMADWCRARGLAWLGLRPENSDLRTLVLDIAGSLAWAYPDTDKVMGNLRASLPVSLDPSGAAMEIVDAMAGVEGGWGICIDDIQQIKEGSLAAALLEKLIELAALNRIPIGLAGRSIPKLKSVSRLRSNPNVVELGGAELEFQPDEVRKVVDSMFELNCTDTLVSRLCSLTQGWPALVVLAAKWLQSRPPEVRESAIEELSGTDRSIYEYLATQILDDRPEIHRQFLLVTSLLRRVPAGLIDELLPGAGLEIVHDLEFGRFVTPSVDSGGTTYTFHPLLGDFLESRALHELSPVTIERVRRTAADWFEKQEIWSEAFRFWQLADDEERIARKMVEWEQLFKEWWTDYGRWLETLDHSVVRRYPRLLLRHAMNSANLGAIESALEWIEMADRAAAEGTEEDRLDVETVRAIVLFFGNFAEESMAICQRLEHKLNSMTPFQRSTLCTALVLLHNNDYIDPERSLKFLEIYEDTVNRAGYLRGRFIATANRAVAARLIGDYEKQRGVLNQLRATVPEGRVPMIYEGLIRFSEALAALELGLPTGQDEMGVAIAVLESFGAKGQIQYGRNVAALSLAESGQPVRDKVAQGAASENHPYKEESNVFGSLALAMEAAKSGNAQRALKLANEAVDASDSEFLKALALLETARIYGIVGDIRGAVERAEKVANVRFRSIATRARILLGSCGLLNSEQSRELIESIRQPFFRDLVERRERTFARQFLVQALEEGIESETAAAILCGMGIRPLRIKTFGGLSVTSGDVTLTAEIWERPQAKALFSYLMLHRSRPVHAEVVVEAFWPDADAKAGRASFKTTCSRVRKALESQGIEATIHVDEDDLVELKLPDDTWLDFEAIERLSKLQTETTLANDRIDVGRRLLALAHGEFLPEYRYEDWAAEKRERLNSILLGVRVRLAGDLLDAGCAEDALSISNDICSADGYDEDGVRLQITALRALSRQKDAAKVLRSYCEKIQNELGLEPSIALLQAATES